MKNARRHRLSAAAVAILGTTMAWSVNIGTRTARAEPPPPRDQENRRPANGQDNDPPRRPGPPGIQRAIDQLELTDGQKPAVNEIVQAYHQKEQQAREELLKQLKATLTPQQYEKLEAAMRRPPGPPPQENREPGNPAPRTQAPAAAPVKSDGEIAVTFTGGYETDPRDGGRPVVLIAAALNVPSEVFREAFSHVTPAKGGEQPQDAQVRKNKAALMAALGPHGITNDQLDTVSNYYRYSSSRGQMWRNTPATATATVRNGVVTAITITNPGSGYSSPPQVLVPGVENAKATVTLTFGTDFKTNGSIREITVGK